MRDATPARPGSFCWPELATRDAAAARRFYGALFGWKSRDAPGVPGAGYAIFDRAGRDAAALTTGMREGEPPHWDSYVAVASADETAAKAKALGGTVVRGPLDVGTNGRMAVVRDPQGAALALWEAKAHPGIGLEGEIGSLCWTELATTDVAAASWFYGGLFGWRFKRGAAGEDYTEVAVGGTYVGGICALDPGPGARPAWCPYFRVADCDVSVAAARASGGRLLAGPSDVPHLGRDALLADPQGAAFAIISFEEVA